MFQLPEVSPDHRRRLKRYDRHAPKFTPANPIGVYHRSVRSVTEAIVVTVDGSRLCQFFGGPGTEGVGILDTHTCLIPSRLLKRWPRRAAEDAGGFQVATDPGHHSARRLDWAVKFPDLNEKARELYEQYRPDSLIVESKATSPPLIQELRNVGLCVEEMGAHRGQDKLTKTNAVADMFSSGAVSGALSRGWAQEVVEEMAGFPYGELDDLQDAAVLGLLRLRPGGFRIAGGAAAVLCKVVAVGLMPPSPAAPGAKWSESPCSLCLRIACKRRTAPIICRTLSSSCSLRNRFRKSGNGDARLIGVCRKKKHANIPTFWGRSAAPTRTRPFRAS